MKYKKVYVTAPYALATGGVELAHQLVHCLRELGLEAFIVYIKDNKISPKQDITEDYSQYNVISVPEIEDLGDNILVLPEVHFHFIQEYQKITIGCWWMSVDNHYVNNISIKDILGFTKSNMQKIKILARYLFRGQYRSGYSDSLLIKEEFRIFHFYQSHYAQNHLYSKGYSKVLPLTDYINTSFIDNLSSSKREDIILYNPAKGYEFTKKIIKANSKYRFVALKGLSREELIGFMRKSKLYIDFGNFPGKDRLPREAMMNGCCVISGKYGASYYYEDLPIDEIYKFDAKDKNIKNITERIDQIMTNYNEHYSHYNIYRQRILSEKENFIKNIKDFFLI